MNFKLDENMPADLGTLLRDRQHDVAEEGLAGEDDPRVLKAATGKVAFC